MSNDRPIPVIFKAAYADLKVVKTRQVAQFIFEVSLSEADAALEVLGGVPRPDVEVWAAIARLDPKAAQSPPAAQLEAPAPRPNGPPPPGLEPAKEHKRFHMLPLSQQAGIRCGDPAFWRYLNEEHFGDGGVEDAEAAAIAVRGLCGVTSRADLKSNTDAGVAWARLNRDFEVWMLG